MILEQQICSLELAQKLKTLGVKQESLWIWFKDHDGIVSYEKPILIDEWIEENWGDDPSCEMFSAFTVAELGEMLPQYLKKFKLRSLEIHKTAIDWLIIYPQTGINARAKTEADARAKMLIYLLENKLI